MKNKLNIIDEICEKHPSYGVEKGWSEYTGGMKDTGEWFVREMFNVNIEELNNFLEKIIAIENKPERKLTKQEKIDSKIIHRIGKTAWITEKASKEIEEMYKQREQRLFGL